MQSSITVTEETENKAGQPVSWDRWKAHCQLQLQKEQLWQMGTYSFNHATPVSQEHVHSGPQKPENDDSMVQPALS